tara:strand:+ start:117 stop:488 length:372 start_codon:yes stop_codon:yes gene_type:complete
MKSTTRLTDTDLSQFREQGYLVARGVFDAGEIEWLREGYDYITSLVAAGGIDDLYTCAKGCEVHIHVQAARGNERWGSGSVSAEGAVAVDDSSGVRRDQEQPEGEIGFPWHQDIRPTPAFRDQ